MSFSYCRRLIMSNNELRFLIKACTEIVVESRVFSISRFTKIMSLAISACRGKCLRCNYGRVLDALVCWHTDGLKCLLLRIPNHCVKSTRTIWSASQKLRRLSAPTFWFLCFHCSPVCAVCFDFFSYIDCMQITLLLWRVFPLNW